MSQYLRPMQYPNSPAHTARGPRVDADLDVLAELHEEAISRSAEKRSSRVLAILPGRPRVAEVPRGQLERGRVTA